MTYLVALDFVNATKGYRFGDSEPEDSGQDEPGLVYKRLASEFGRCTSKVYRDTDDGVKVVGWAFVKKMEYDDWRPSRGGERYYLRETWATLFEACEPEDPRACTTRHRNGAVTRHPFKPCYLARG